MVLALLRQHKGTNSPSFRIPVVDESRPLIRVNALTLLYKATSGGGNEGIAS